MGFIRYLGSCLWLAFRHSFGKADTITLIVIIIVGVLSWSSRFLSEEKAYPSILESVMQLDEWQIAAMVLGVIVLARLILAPYWMYKKIKTERNEANIKILELENDSKESLLQRDISSLIIEGTSVIGVFKSIDIISNDAPMQEFHNWRENIFEVLTRHHLNDVVALLHRDISVNSFSRDDFIEACEKGLNRLEGILKLHGRQI